jgi:subtilisin family serine protease
MMMKLLSSALLSSLLLLLSSSTSWLLVVQVGQAQVQAQAQQASLTLPVINNNNNNITGTDIEIRTNPKFRRGTGEIRVGSYIVGLSSDAVEREAVVEAIDRLVNETRHNMTTDGGGEQEEGGGGGGVAAVVVVVGAILQHAFRGFTWTESNPVRRLALLKRLLNSSLVDFIEEDQVVKLYQASAGNNQICPGSWGLDRIDQWAPPTNGVYHYDWTGASVDVFVLDTGILATHEQFEGRATCAVSYVQGKVIQC